MKYSDERTSQHHFSNMAYTLKTAGHKRHQSYIC